MKSIDVLKNCAARGKSLSKGKTYLVPEEVSEDDAKALVKMRRAVPTPDDGGKPASGAGKA